MFRRRFSQNVRRRRPHRGRAQKTGKVAKTLSDARVFRYIFLTSPNVCHTTRHETFQRYSPKNRSISFRRSVWSFEKKIIINGVSLCVHCVYTIWMHVDRLYNNDDKPKPTLALRIYIVYRISNKLTPRSFVSGNNPDCIQIDIWHNFPYRSRIKHWACSTTIPVQNINIYIYAVPLALDDFCKSINFSLRDSTDYIYICIQFYKAAIDDTYKAYIVHYYERGAFYFYFETLPFNLSIYFSILHEKTNTEHGQHRAV